LICLQCGVVPLVIKELKRIVEQSKIVKQLAHKLAKKNIVAKQGLAILTGNDHIMFETAKIGSLVVDIQSNQDPEGSCMLYYLVQDLKVHHLHPVS
ncbi:Mago nashi protein, partial [Lactarius quietus]